MSDIWSVGCDMCEETMWDMVDIWGNGSGVFERGNEWENGGASENEKI